ncbi:hypothetical protein [Caldinitratiruptor microaerophilus]|uniref:Uncharacterized protein n=1 Tax=Caldinitratiruptor microaerophilus TaxID=671077 RepID=A0AA35CHP0_9FIRM|nr:hypothetical protein [Caldinitratiruptor microaerophilus]BDG59057.1 hypothetical protein caldi_01470 [Caldinitratiruptor microaerophilus]
MREPILCNWCGTPLELQPAQTSPWLCPDCDVAHESDAARYLEGPKEDTHDV